jgi:hypothetical protein
MILSFCVDFDLFLLFLTSVLILSFPCSSELFLALLCYFAWLCRFFCSLLAFALFSLLDDLKITATISWFEPQNQVGFGLSVAPQNRRREVGAGHASRSSSLLGVEANLARVSESGLKTGGGATMGCARGTVAEVASEASWRWMGRCDGLCQTLLPLICRFLSIMSYGHNSHLAFCLSLYIGP